MMAMLVKLEGGRKGGGGRSVAGSEVGLVQG